MNKLPYKDKPYQAPNHADAEQRHPIETMPILTERLLGRAGWKPGRPVMPSIFAQVNSRATRNWGKALLMDLESINLESVKFQLLKNFQASYKTGRMIMNSPNIIFDDKWPERLTDWPYEALHSLAKKGHWRAQTLVKRSHKDVQKFCRRVMHGKHRTPFLDEVRNEAIKLQLLR